MSWRQQWENGKGRKHCPIPPPKHPTYDLHEAIKEAVREDQVDIGDLTTLFTVDKQQQALGTFLAKADGVLAGLGVVDEVFRVVAPDCEIQWYKKDGDKVENGSKFGNVRGDASSLLKAERIALNYMQRMSGIATATSLMQRECEGTDAKIIETRKTVPGLRLLDKWAVLIGGGSNHRMGLYDMLMVKDNHVTAAGGITNAVRKCQAELQERNVYIPFEVETRSLEEVQELLDLREAGLAYRVTRVMLDNMAHADSSQPGGVDVTMLKQAVKLIDGRLETEASGNVTIDTVKQIAQTGVTFISCGALTHSVKALDISLKIKLCS